MYDTPKRAEVKAIFRLNQHFNLGLTQRQLFDFAQVPENTGYSILHTETTRTPSYHNGRPPTLQNNEEGTKRIVQLIEDEGFEAARMTWSGMAAEASVSVNVSHRTMRRHMHQEGFYKRKAA